MKRFFEGSGFLQCLNEHLPSSIREASKDTGHEGEHR